MAEVQVMKIDKKIHFLFSFTLPLISNPFHFLPSERKSFPEADPHKSIKQVAVENQNSQGSQILEKYWLRIQNSEGSYRIKIC